MKKSYFPFHIAEFISDGYYLSTETNWPFSQHSSQSSIYDMVKGPKQWKERPKNFKCEYCDKAFVVRRDWLGHLNSVHLKQRPYSCSNCQANFANYKCWKSHTKNCNLFQTNKLLKP